MTYSFGRKLKEEATAAEHKLVVLSLQLSS